MSKIEMKPVMSSCVMEVGYDEPSQVMQIRFLTGRLYRYSNVNPDEFREISEASSVGSAFWEILRRRESEHPYERVE